MSHNWRNTVYFYEILDTFMCSLSLNRGIFCLQNYLYLSIKLEISTFRCLTDDSNCNKVAIRFNYAKFLFLTSSNLRYRNF